MPLDTLENTLVHELSDLLSAENQFSKALQKVAKAADSDAVKQMAEEHLQETQGQIENLKQAFSALGQKPEKMVCKGAQGIVEENDSTLKEEKPKGALKDVALISGSMRIEHYEIAGYSSAIAVAKQLGRREVVQLLQANLKQEQATSKKLEAAAPQILKSAAGATATGATASAPSAKSTGAKSATAKSAGAKAGAAKASAAKNGRAKSGTATSPAQAEVGS